MLDERIVIGLIWSVPLVYLAVRALFRLMDYPYEPPQPWPASSIDRLVFVGDTSERRVFGALVEHCSIQPDLTLISVDREAGTFVVKTASSLWRPASFARFGVTATANPPAGESSSTAVLVQVIASQPTPLGNHMVGGALHHAERFVATVTAVGVVLAEAKRPPAGTGPEVQPLTVGSVRG